MYQQVYFEDIVILISKNCIDNDNRRQKNDELIVDKHCRYKREINKYCMKTVDLDNIVSV